MMYGNWPVAVLSEKENTRKRHGRSVVPTSAGSILASAQAEYRAYLQRAQKVKGKGKGKRLPKKTKLTDEDLSQGVPCEKKVRTPSSSPKSSGEDRPVLRDEQQMQLRLSQSPPWLVHQSTVEWHHSRTLLCLL